MMTDGVGLYLHIPFCLQKCNYCDFCSLPGSTNKIDGYITRLCDEIFAYKREKKIAVSTVYFGGGTPSLLNAFQMERILHAVREVFDISSEAEMSMEANPGTVDSESLAEYRRLGINRISFGLQSIHENELKKLGRIHKYYDFERAYKAARSVGFDNISVDLMFGIPEQTMDTLRQTLEAVMALSPEHISLYGLIIEEGTPFHKERSRLDLPDEETEARMYDDAARILTEGGYIHYEISNFSVSGRECLHNLKYWRDEEYIGVGVAAYSYFEGKRYGNSSDFEEYISSHGLKYSYAEDINEADRAFEYAMMRLRLAEGIDLSDYESEFGRPFIGENSGYIEDCIKRGLMRIHDGSLSLTRRGFYLSNTILSSIL